MTAFSVDRPGTPATVKIPFTCQPECGGTPPGSVTGTPTGAPSSKIVKLTATVVPRLLNTPTLVRKPSPEPPFRIEVKTVVGNASESRRPGMNMPTVGVGSVE